MTFIGAGSLILDRWAALNALRNMRTRSIRFLLISVFGLIISTSLEACKKSEKQSPEQVNEKAVAMNREIMKQPQTVATLGALSFLKQLKKEGHLPGTPADETGMFRHETPSEITPSGRVYSSVEIHYFTTAGPSRNCFYVVEQVASNSPPHLVKAWAADEAGKTIQTYLVQ